MGALLGLVILAFLYWLLDGEGADCCVAAVIGLIVLIAALALGN